MFITSFAHSYGPYLSNGSIRTPGSNKKQSSKAVQSLIICIWDRLFLWCLSIKPALPLFLMTPNLLTHKCECLGIWHNSSSFHDLILWYTVFTVYVECLYCTCVQYFICVTTVVNAKMWLRNTKEMINSYQIHNLHLTFISIYLS